MLIITCRTVCTFLFACLLVHPARGQSAEALHEARTLVLEGNHRAAIRLLEAAPADSLTPAGRYLLGLSYQAAMQHERALEVLHEADTTDPAVRAAVGRSLDLLGQPREAAQQYALAYRLDSTSTSVALNLARLYADLGQWEDVRSIYARLLAEDDANAFLHAQLAATYSALDSLDEAIVHYERARQLNPRSVGVALNLSALYMGTERLISARRVIDGALSEQPDEPLLWQRSGDIAIREEHFEGAVAAYRNALALGDSTALNLRNYGVSLYLTANVDSALTPLLASFERDSTDGMTAFYLGAVYQQQAAYDRALTYLEKAVDLMGRSVMGDAYAQIAAVYDQMEQDGEAIRVYRLAMSLNPDDPENLFHLAALYDAYYADPATALEHYNEFLERIEEGQFADLQRYARTRVSEITEVLFFQQGKTPPVDTLATDTTHRN